MQLYNREQVARGHATKVRGVMCQRAGVRIVLPSLGASKAMSKVAAYACICELGKKKTNFFAADIRNVVVHRLMKRCRKMVGSGTSGRALFPNYR